MNAIHLISRLFTALTAALLLAACAKEEPAVTAGENSLLAWVPADTPYVLANLEPVPDDVTDAWLTRVTPMLAEAQRELSNARLEIENADPELNSEHEAQFHAVASAVLQELDGKLNRAGLESLGLSLAASHVIHANGLLPTVRLGLGNPEALRAAVDRVSTNSGVAIPEQELQGRRYWKLPVDDAQVALYVAILDDHLAIGSSATALEAEFLPEFLGLEMPAESLADTNALGQLASDKGYLAYGLGFLDLRKLVEELFDPESRTVRNLAAVGAWDPTALEPVCAQEARELVNVAPRLTGGLTDLTADSVALRYQMEIETGLAGKLAGLVADVPAAPVASGHLLDMSLGLRLGALRDLLLELANARVAKPLACSQWADLNARASQVAEQLAQPMPPFVFNLKGLRLQAHSFDPEHPERSSGLLALEVNSPQMLVGLASSFIPGIEELGIKPGADPARLPEELLSIVTPEVEVYAVMTDDSIGLSYGANQQAGLAAFLAQTSKSGDSWFSLEYDMQALSQLHQAAIADAEEHVNGEDVAAAMLEQLGRSRLEFRFDGEGITVDNSMTFR